jgi:uncharacterized protein (TIGR03435 family)
MPEHFDVASIKPNLTGGEARRATGLPGGGFTASNVSLRLLISRAYGVGENQIEGGRRWVATETWDISARADTPAELTREQLRRCLEALLTERFHLTMHYQIKQGTVFSLVATKSGPKLKEHVGEGTSAISLSSVSSTAVINGSKATMARLAEYLTGPAGRRVINNTGLPGEYDFHVEWSTDGTDSQLPSVFAAIQEQLGLKLEAMQGPIEMIVVDMAERASPN